MAKLTPTLIFTAGQMKLKLTNQSTFRISEGGVTSKQELNRTVETGAAIM